MPDRLARSPRPPLLGAFLLKGNVADPTRIGVFSVFEGAAMAGLIGLRVRRFRLQTR